VLKQESDSVLRQYLLGQLPEDAQERLEQQLMTNTDFSEQLSAVEDELTDEYVSGTLRDRDRKAFETVFLAHPSRQQRVAFAKTLHEFVEMKAETARPSQTGRQTFLAFLLANRPLQAAAAGFVLLLVVTAWLSVRVYRLQDQLRSSVAQQTPTTNEPAQRERTEPDLNNPQTLPFVTVVLLPGAARDAGGIQRVIVPAGSEAAKLQLALETDEYPSYDATLQTPEGNTVWTEKGLSAVKTSAGTVISVWLSRDVLKPQDYILRINGVRNGSSEPVNAYYFRGR
jgi:hypothetical protein